MAVNLPRKAASARKRQRLMRPIKPTRAARAAYTSELLQQVDYLKAQTVNLSDLIKSGAGRQAVAARLMELAQQSQARFDQLAPSTARSFVSKVDRQQKEAMQRTIRDALQVDFAQILDTPNTAADVDLAVSWNTSLIKSIGAKHWDDVGQAVLDNYRGAELPGGVSLTERLQQLGGISERRAQFIARDQTAKLTTALNKSRQESAGIEEYVWRTAGDERVVGTPGGLYPDGSRGHENHYKRDGKRFKWSEPPADGHPGQAYNCRCVALPVLDLDKLDVRYV